EEERTAEAGAQWRAALTQQPSFTAAWIGLAELLLAQQRWQNLDQVFGHLETTSHAMEVAVIRARAQLARRDFASARQILEACIDRAPTALWPRVILTHVLLQEGNDWDAAEGALREVLALDPDHSEARRN